MRFLQKIILLHQQHAVIVQGPSGIPAERIYAYGIAFRGKNVLVAGGKAAI